jgi:hypothetical protein
MLDASQKRIHETRKETFNRKIMKDFQEKATLAAELETKLACMTYNEGELDKFVDERDSLAK